VAEATSKQIDNGSKEPGAGYGYFWWIRGPDRYEAVGIFGQSITTFRNERIIVVQNAAWPAATGRELSAARNAMLEGVLRAAK
jgi:CubicO group peptidase (beta-lactamase class C family)